MDITSIQPERARLGEHAAQSAPRPDSGGSFRTTLRRVGSDGVLVDRQRSFMSATARGHRNHDADPSVEARRTAASFVASALIAPVLAQLRENSQAAPPFAPTRGEQQFRELADADLAQRIALSRGFGLVDRLAQDLLEASGERGDARSAIDQLRAATT